MKNIIISCLLALVIVIPLTILFHINGVQSAAIGFTVGVLVGIFDLGAKL
jgi:hypothetical protein